MANICEQQSTYMNHEGMISQHLTTQQDHLRKKTKRNNLTAGASSW